MVRTGAHAYVKYEFEDDGYGNLVSGQSPNKKFGLQDKLTSLSLTNIRRTVFLFNCARFILLLVSDRLVNLSCRPNFLLGD
jgi:hypothetical protein